MASSIQRERFAVAFDCILLAYRYLPLQPNGKLFLSRWPPTTHTKLQNLSGKLIVMFTAPVFKWYVLSNTHDLGHLTTFYSFLTTFPSSGSDSHIFCLLGVGKSANAPRNYRILYKAKYWSILKFPLTLIRIMLITWGQFHVFFITFTLGTAFVIVACSIS